MQSTTMGARQVTFSLSEKYQKILLTHDGSEMSDKALRDVVHLSKTSGAELVILNVMDSEVIPPRFLLKFIRP
jgi:nucleotide-binding universal stress UspA family protein